MATDSDFVAYPSRGRIGAMVAGSAGFVALGIWMAGIFGPVPEVSRYSEAVIMVVGWLSILFFGACLIAWGKRLFETGEELRIGPDGIRASRWSDQTIPWAEIRDVSVWSHKKTRMIVLHLRDPGMFPGRGMQGKLAALNRSLTRGDVSIPMTGTDRNLDEALAAIAAFSGRAGPGDDGVRHGERTT